MALFTFVLFDGGTYISQSSARSAGRAVAQYASDLVRNEAVLHSRLGEPSRKI